MKLSYKVFVLLCLTVSLSPINSFSAVNKTARKMGLSGKQSRVSKSLLHLFKKVYKNNKDLDQLRNLAFKKGKKAVPVLIEVMKGKSFPDKNRWVATFMLGKIMGKDAAPFIAKFTSHPHWVMKLASFKTLLALNQKKYIKNYARGLRDKSMLVRFQSLENIRRLKLAKAAPAVWKMLWDKTNYVKVKGKGTKRMPILKSAIRTVGDLKYKKAFTSLKKMISRKKYKDISQDIDYALSRITGQFSPNGSMKKKMNYWKNFKRKI